MKKLLRLAGVCSLLCAALAIPSPAQIATQMDFTTTFPFMAGNTKLPAGSYTVRPSGMDENVLLIEDLAKKASAFIEITPTQSENVHKTTETSFKKYGTTDFLDQLWIAGQQYGMQILPTKVEQKMAQGGTATPHSVPAKGK
jgi:hypothetical protein